MLLHLLEIAVVCTGNVPEGGEAEAKPAAEEPQQKEEPKEKSEPAPKKAEPAAKPAPEKKPEEKPEKKPEPPKQASPAPPVRPIRQAILRCLDTWRLEVGQPYPTLYLYTGTQLHA